jgi:hypothetical protein
MRELVKINYFPTSTESNKGADNNANEVGANASEYLYAEDGANGSGTDLRIIGDPAWIQQGSLTGRLTNGKDFSIQPFLPDGTINYDASQVMFEVSWQRPEDYDLSTGLADPYARPGNASRQPQQSNVYVATKVTHEFRGGKFEQVINGALFNYPKTRWTQHCEWWCNSWQKHRQSSGSSRHSQQRSVQQRHSRTRKCRSVWGENQCG